MNSFEVDIRSSVAELVASGLTDEQIAEEITNEILSGSDKQGKKIAKERVETERRWREEGVRYYEPFDYVGGQLDAHKSTAKVRLVVAPNRSGKTTFDVAEVNWWATGTHPYRKTPKPPVRIRVCCTDFLNGIEKVMIPKFKEFVIREDLVGGNWDQAYSKERRTLSFKNGSFVEFMSYDQDVEKFGGTSRHLIVEDEPAPGDIHNENMTRLLDVGGEIIMTLTPVNLNARTSWIYDSWLSRDTDPDMECFFFDIYKNTALSKEYIDKFVASIRDEGERMARVEGKFPQFAGLVYKGFSRGKHVIAPFTMNPDEYSFFLAIDPHPREPIGVIFGAIDRDGNKYIWDEILETGRAKIIVDMIKVKLDKRKLEYAVMDNSAKSPNQVLGGRSIWHEFVDPDGDGSDRGIFSILVSGKDKDVWAGISSVENHLGLDAVYQKPRLFIFNTCVSTIHQFETYLWDDYKHKTEKELKPKVRKKNDHLMDCVRYWLMSNPAYVKVRRPGDDQYSSPYAYLNRSGK